MEHFEDLHALLGAIVAFSDPLPMIPSQDAFEYRLLRLQQVLFDVQAQKPSLIVNCTFGLRDGRSECGIDVSILSEMIPGSDGVGSVVNHRLSLNPVWRFLV